VGTENRIAEILADRKDEGLEGSQEWLAREVGMSVFTLNHMIHGRRAVAKHLQRKIAIALGVPLGRVFPRPSKMRASG